MSKRLWPSGDAAFNQFYRNLTQIVTIKTSGADPAWKHIPKAEADGFVDRYADWYGAYAATLIPHIPSLTTAKNEARKRAEKDIRRFKRLYLDGDYVTDAERVDMDFPIRDVVASVIPAPTIPAEGDIFYPGAGMVEVGNIRPVAAPGTVYDKRSNHGVSIAYGIMGKTKDKFPLQEVPLTGDDLPHSKFTRLKRRTFNLQGESGNTVYFCLRYENAKGEPGPWGPMLKAIIP